MEVPFVVFETKSGRFAIDGYFVNFLSLEPRKVVLIKDASKEKFSTHASNPLPLLLEGNLKSFLVGLLKRLEEEAGKAIDARISHMRRWNLLRVFGIPTGHERHVVTDERLAQIERENALGLAILKRILGVRGTEDLDRITVRRTGVVYLNLILSSGKIIGPSGVDRVYTNLLWMDQTFRTAFFSAYFRNSILSEEIKRKCQDFAYSQQAT